MDNLSDLPPDMPLPAASDVKSLRETVTLWRSGGLRVGFVPTMGALHAGHVSLIDLAHRHCDRVVASVFVNPAQFAAGEDFDAYPRTLTDDAKTLAEHGCDLLYAPTARAMYPDGFDTNIHVGGPSAGLETAFRPHFFNGVATVVAKLLTQVRPDIAVFGEKDYQQLLVVERLVTDLDLGVDIIPGPIVREADGLALSSRNAYLSPEHRIRAAKLYAILNAFVSDLKNGIAITNAQTEALEAAQSAFDSVDYIEARCAETLTKLPEGPINRTVRVLAAVMLGQTRLIDNLAVAPD